MCFEGDSILTRILKLRIMYSFPAFVSITELETWQLRYFGVGNST
jgi:hypothetical protein